MTAPDATRWWRWHDDYADPSSSLSRRLAVVVKRVREAVEAAPPGPVRLVSLCAGQAHDVVQALAGHPRAADVTGRLVEWDPDNVAAARAALAEAGLCGIEMVQGDASSTDALDGVVPADIVLLCGIFGNVPDEDVERTVRNAPRFCAAGATVVWTRHRRTPDLTPAIRGWFGQSGFEEVGFDSPGEDSFAVGTCRLVHDPLPYVGRLRLFTFF